MVRVAIVEDEEGCRSRLSGFMEQYGQEQQMEFDVHTFSDGDGILEAKEKDFDIIFMDVQMPFVDGFAAAREIREKDKEVVIIFVTTAAQYAIKGYEVGAFDYMVKPVSYFAFSGILRKACAGIEKKQKSFLTFKVKSGMVRVDTDDIYYIESLRHTLCIHTVNGDYESYGTMKEYEEALQKESFCRGNKGYLINLRYVSEIREQSVIVKGNELLLSRGRRGDFLRTLMNYWAERQG